MSKKILSFITAVLLSCSLLTGCANEIPVKSTPIVTQQNLLQKCSDDTPVPERSGFDKNNKPASTGEDMMKAWIAFQDMYNECAVTHDKLVDAILQQQNATHVPD